MRFSSVIKDHLNVILEEWDAFARTLLPAGRAISDEELRDHCRAILQAIADMDREQSEGKRSAKSTQVHKSDAADTAASSHGKMRQTSGFNFPQLVAEFRAMRASVPRLWSQADAAGLPKPAAEEIARFDEALDQALDESVERYTADAAESRELFLAVLAHDARSPLSNIRLSTEVLLRPTLPDRMCLEVAVRVRRASETIGLLTTDVLEYAGSRLGRGMSVHLKETELRSVCEDAIDAVRSNQPEREIVWQAGVGEQDRLGLVKLSGLWATNPMTIDLNGASKHGAVGRLCAACAFVMATFRVLALRVEAGSSGSGCFVKHGARPSANYAHMQIG